MCNRMVLADVESQFELMDAAIGHISAAWGFSITAMHATAAAPAARRPSPGAAASWP